ncbi:MAG: hypothetical protein ACJ8R9_03685 [Steroidobacteraceae bacterium]
MKCLYYTAPTLDSARRISDDVHEVGVQDFFLHVIAKDAAGLAQRHIPAGNYLETLDLVRDGLIGSAIGLCAGLLGAALLKVFAPFGPHLPNIVYFATIAAATLFGAWEGGLTGIASENKKLAKFHDDLEAGRCLILIYALQEQEAAVVRMMRTRHPEAQLAAIDRHFINPFSSLTRPQSPLLEGGLTQEN